MPSSDPTNGNRESPPGRRGFQERMLTERKLKAARIEVPATSANLGPGFDCLGLALALSNTVEVEYDEGSRDVRLESVTGSEKEDLDPDDNLICNAYREWRRAVDPDVPGVRFHLDLGVPMARGLGTSAAAIVAGLAAACFYPEKKLDRQRIINLAARIEQHPDNVVPCVVEIGRASCRERV